MPEEPLSSDDRQKQENIKLQNEFGEVMAAAGYRVRWQAPPRIEEGVSPRKRPEMSLGDHSADVTAPSSDDVGQVRKAVSRKVREGQAFRIMVDLVKSRVTREQLAAVLARRPITGLQELFVREQGGAVWRMLPDPEFIAEAPRVFLPPAASR